MLQNANVSHGKTMMGMVVGRRELPCVRRLMSLHKGNVIRCAAQISMGGKKGMKKQRRDTERKLTKRHSFVAQSGV
jgi:hypothetical protein